MTARVAVTGLGVQSPAGTDPGAFFGRLCEGTGTAAPISAFDASTLPVGFACEVRDFDPTRYLGPKEVRRVDRVAQLGLAAALDAWSDAASPVTDPARCGVVAGAGIGGLLTLEAQERILIEQGPARVSPFLVPMLMPNAAAALVSLQLGWTGPTVCMATACAAGTHAIGEGMRLVRDGTADVVLAGGAEAVITPVALAAFARMGALSTRHHDPASASRPFDARRDGFVMGEGAAFVVLETEERARARGARIYGFVDGYGRNADAHHITAPSPGGAGAAACMDLALVDAGIDARAIGHINAHGTSTPLNDAAEAEAIRKVFGDAPPPVTSTKGTTGHLIAAAGAVEAVASLLAMAARVIPPTANHTCTDPELGLDIVAGTARPWDPAPVVSNSFGFGGHNATIVLTPPGL